MRIQARPIAGLGLKTGGALALIRELHVYGPEVPLGKRKPVAAQHRGLGRALLLEGERIAGEEFGVSLIAVLSGVGAREYYRSGFGYVLEGNYMVKEL
jgi:elongator complex protein 3